MKEENISNEYKVRRVREKSLLKSTTQQMITATCFQFPTLKGYIQKAQDACCTHLRTQGSEIYY